jgi:hypothetical protein
MEKMAERSPAMNGVPPGSGGKRLYLVKGIGKDTRMTEALIDSLMPGRPWATANFVGVRFPASDPDPGRWYREEKA